MKKIGICTINDNDNYGNRVQNYAVQEIFKKYGMQCYTIINTTQKVEKEKVNMNNFFPRCIRKSKYLFSKIYDFNKYRKKCFYDFNKNINFYEHKIDSKNIPKNLNNDFDIFFTGSDQVWNPTFPRTSSIDFLTFANEEKRNSFSASFGVSEIPDNMKNYYKEKLNALNYISVREDRGKEIITELTGRKDLEVLVDPTMLLSCNEWDKVAKKPIQKKNNKKYILNYFLGNLSNERKNEIDRIAKENECEIINILDKKSRFYQTGPSEFLWLEKNAFVICTDSFHASVFAILYNTPFIVFKREDDFESMNSRLDTLLTKFKLKDRYFNGNISEGLLEGDYISVHNILKDERNKANNFIEKCIEKENK